MSKTKIVKFNLLTNLVLLILLLILPIGRFHFIDHHLPQGTIIIVFGFTQLWIILLSLYGIFWLLSLWHKTQTSDDVSWIDEFRRLTIYYSIYHFFVFVLWFFLFPTFGLLMDLYKVDDCILSLVYNVELCTAVDIEMFDYLDILLFLPILGFINYYLLRYGLIRSPV